jgi:hypothetical protein
MQICEGREIARGARTFCTPYIVEIFIESMTSEKYLQIDATSDDDFLT